MFLFVNNTLFTYFRGNQNSRKTSYHFSFGEVSSNLKNSNVHIAYPIARRDLSLPRWIECFESLMETICSNSFEVQQMNH